MLRGAVIRRLVLLGAVVACGKAFGQPPTVAIDLTALDAPAYRRLDAVGLESRAVLRLVQEGFAVVTPGAKPELTIRIFSSANALVLEASGARKIVPIGTEPIRELHLEVAQKIVDLARELLRNRPDAGEVPIVDAGVALPEPILIAAVDAGIELIPPAARRPVEAAVSGGVVIRGAAVDPIVQLDFRLPLGESLAIDFLAAMTGSSGLGISVLEPELLGGVGYRFSLTERWAIEVRLLVGAALHVYSLDDRTAVDLAGNRADFLASVPVSVFWNPVSDLVVALKAAPGVLSRTREHIRAGKVLWRREAFRVEAAVTVGWRF